jgi:hypothetical protein
MVLPDLMGYTSVLQELMTDNPFLISPRITFEVSVRLLGGLMALGYTIAAILKRTSHVFSDEKVIVKIDWLEQLKRQYVQVWLCISAPSSVNTRIGIYLCLGICFISFI